MAQEIKIGLTNEVSDMVTEKNTAVAMGSGNFYVFAVGNFAPILGAFAGCFCL